MLYAKHPDYPPYRIYLDGRVYNEKSDRFLKPTLCSDGYRRISFKYDNKERKFLIHRLLAICFMPCSKNFSDVTVDHINIDRTDNRQCNLRWLDYHGQNLNRLYKETNTGYPFINENKNKKSNSGSCNVCRIYRNGKYALNTTRVNLDDAIERVRSFLKENMNVLDGLPREKIDKIKEIYKLV